MFLSTLITLDFTTVFLMLILVFVDLSSLVSLTVLLFLTSFLTRFFVYFLVLISEDFLSSFEDLDLSNLSS